MALQGLTTETNASNNEVALINEYVTGPPAEALLTRCGLLKTQTTSPAPLRLLDNATGIGTLIFRLLGSKAYIQIDQIIGADIDVSYLSFLRERASKHAHSSIEALQLDQQAPGLDSDSFDYIFNNFGVFFASDDEAVLKETHRMLKSGGFAGFTSWAKISWWDEILIPALERYAPDAPPLPHPSKLFAPRGWTDPQSTKVRLESAGFRDVEAEIWAFTPDVDPKDFAMACTHLVKAISARAWSEQDRGRFEPRIEQAFLDYLNNTFEGGRWTGKMSAVLTWGKK